MSSQAIFKLLLAVSFALLCVATPAKADFLSHGHGYLIRIDEQTGHATLFGPVTTGLG